MNRFCGGFLIFLGIGFLVTMLIIVPLTVKPPPTTEPEDMGFAVPPASTKYLQSVCPCFAGIPDFATNERDISNAYFNQDAGEDCPDPRGLSTFVWGWGQVAFFF